MKDNFIFASLKLKDDSDRKNAVVRAVRIQNSNASGIIIREKYQDDDIHELNINTIRDICSNVSIPVYCAVNDNCDEDVKKYLYAGCDGVVIKSSDEALLTDSVNRFANGSISQEAFTENSINADNKPNLSFSDFKTNEDELIPCIVQDYKDGCVLMMAYMNQESFNATLETKLMTYYSRSRQKLWVKGEESGHFQHLLSLSADCDCDTLLAKVKQEGVACHTGSRSCFFNDIVGNTDNNATSSNVFNSLYEIILDRKNHPKEGSYTNYLFSKGIDKILKKVGEESTEIVIAAKNPDTNELIYEISDLIYHISVLMAQKNITWDDIATELNNR